jgi:hypothetical protein
MSDDRVRAALRALGETVTDPERVQLGDVERRIAVRRRRARTAGALVTAVIAVAVISIAVARSGSSPHGVVVPATQSSAPVTTTTRPRPAGAPSDALVAIHDGRLVHVTIPANVATSWGPRTTPADAFVEVTGPTVDRTFVGVRRNRSSCPGDRNVAQYSQSDPSHPRDVVLGFGDHLVASPDGTLIGYHGFECRFDVGINWTDLSNRTNFRATGDSVGYVPLTWSPDSSRLLVAKGDDVRWIPRAHIGSTLDPAPGLTPGPYAAVARTGELLTTRGTGDQREVVAVDPDTGRVLRELFPMRYGPVLQIAVDPSGTRVAVLVDARSVHGARGYGELLTWDATSGELSEMGGQYSEIAWLSAAGTSP